MILFTDGSANTFSKVGYGAYLTLTEPEPSQENLSSQIKVKRFTQTSSTKLELQTLLWALDDIQPATRKLTIYSDSQNIIDLPARRSRLEQNDYCTKRGKRLNNFLLYQEFYRLTDQRDCQFVKVSGHLPINQKNDIDRCFTLVDKAARIALRVDNG